MNGKLLKPLTRKLNCWAERSLIENFKLKNKDTGWQWGRKIKNYLWLRIYREGDSKKVFFIIGINSKKELYVELNCLRDDYADGSTDALTPEKISEFDNYLKLSEYQKKIIKGKKLKQYNWDRLITEAQDYIYDFGALYDELEKLVTDGESPGIERDSLIESDAPAKTKSHVKKGKTFIGSRTDWGKKQKTSKVLGDEGEKLVMKYERKKLKKSELHKEAELVQKKLDGEGYDILSYDENGEEIHIEVKTTKGGIDEPFYMSENEKVYFEQKSMNYRLYRLYNFKFPTKTAKFYILTADQLDNADFNSLNYEVVLSETEKGGGG